MTVNSSGTRRLDPLGIQTGLPLTGTYHPLGFRLDLATNSRDVIEAAEESWGGQPLEDPSDPLVLHVRVNPEGELAQIPSHYKQEHLYSVVADPQNFAHIDLRTLFGFIHLTQKTASDHSWLRWFFLESTVYLMLGQRHVVMVHAACVAREGRGILLCGASTSGKSTLSYACARAGWTFVTDDCACLLPDSPERIAIGRPRQARFRLDAPKLFPELERYTARARPTGKIGIEVPMSAMPNMRTASRTSIDALVFLDRRPGPPFAQALSPEEAADRLITDLPCYGEEVDAIHEATVRRLVAAPAFCARYECIDDGLALLSNLL